MPASIVTVLAPESIPTRARMSLSETSACGLSADVSALPQADVIDGILGAPRHRRLSRSRPTPRRSYASHLSAINSNDRCQRGPKSAGKRGTERLPPKPRCRGSSGSLPFVTTMARRSDASVSPDSSATGLRVPGQNGPVAIQRLPPTGKSVAKRRLS
jgi:hypothetical protein